MVKIPPLLLYLVAIVVGIFAPLEHLSFLIVYLLMGTLFFIFLSIDAKAIVANLKQPLLLVSVLTLNLICIPLLVFLLSYPFELSTRIALVLIAALPTGASAGVYTQLYKGKTSLTIVLTVLSTLVSILTIPLIMFILFQTKIELDYGSLLFSLVRIIIIPFLLAELAKRTLKKSLLKQLIHKADIWAISFTSLLVAVIVSNQSTIIRMNLSKVFLVIVLLLGMFTLFQLLTFILVKGDRPTKLAISVSKTFMNIGLGVSLAHLFFQPEVILIVAVSIIPWSLMSLLIQLYFTVRS